MNQLSENETFSQQVFIAKTIAGLEDVLADEITALGAQNVQKLSRAVSFEGDKKLLYRTNYSLRTALRILVPLHTFQLANEDDLYRNIYDYPWENHLKVTDTLAVDAVVTDSELTHSHFVALRTKDAICDRFRASNNGRRPSVDTDNPGFRINIHINGNQCDVLADSSGASLHKRGYRVSNAEAPMSEVLAAGLILLSDWDKKSNFIDPMCGSGTLLIEAALIANNFPPGMYRKDFGFMHWNDFDPELWESVKQEALDEQTEFEYKILGSDISPKNLSSAHANIKSARLHKDIQVQVSAFENLKPPKNEPGIIVMNPPYGERIRPNDIIGLYRSIGDALKQSFTGYNAWIISSDQMAIKFIGLKPTEKYIVWNGPLECKYEKFEVYQGSKKYESDQGDEHISRPPRRKEFTDYHERTGQPERNYSETRPDRSGYPKEKRSFDKDRSERDKPSERRSYSDSRNRDARPWSKDEKHDRKPPFKDRDNDRSRDKKRTWNDQEKPARPASDKREEDRQGDAEKFRERRSGDKRPYNTDEDGRRIYPNKRDERKKLYSDRPAEQSSDRPERNENPRSRDDKDRPHRHFEKKEYREIEEWTPRERPEPKIRVEHDNRPKKEEKFEPSQKPKRPRSVKPPKPPQNPGSKGLESGDKWEEMGD